VAGWQWQWQWQWMGGSVAVAVAVDGWQCGSELGGSVAVWQVKKWRALDQY
jgi:hypothetical protein